MSLHPRQQPGGGANGEARKVFVGLAMGDAEQILPIIGLGIMADEGSRGGVVHEAKVARVAAIASAKRAWRMFEQHDAGAGFARREGCAETGIAAADDEDVTGLRRVPFSVTSRWDLDCIGCESGRTDHKAGKTEGQRPARVRKAPKERFCAPQNDSGPTCSVACEAATR